MILYSIIPAEEVFRDTKEQNKIIEIDYYGEKVEAIVISNSEYRINRVLSTSLNSYLNPKLQPGNTIQLSSVKRF